MATVLLIDDSGFSRRRLRQMVEAEGYSVIEAPGGSEGLDSIENEKPDCVLLDLNMPEVTGFDVLERLKNQQSRTPVVMVSADIQSTSKDRCLELGARAFLNKPPKPEELRETLNSVMG